MGQNKGKNQKAMRHENRKKKEFKQNDTGKRSTNFLKI
jgi:hypothetical protein